MRTWSQTEGFRCPFMVGNECVREKCVFWGVEWEGGHVYGCLLRLLARYAAAKIGWDELLHPGRKEVK